MMNFPDFCKSFSTLYALESSKTAQYIYENVIGAPGVRTRMALASEFRVPALSVCAKEIERICEQANSDLTLDRTVKQGIGRMVSESLRELGYVVHIKSSRLPAALHLNYFVNAATYRRDKIVQPEVFLEVVLSGAVDYREILNDKKQTSQLE